MTKEYSEQLKLVVEALQTEEGQAKMKAAFKIPLQVGYAKLFASIREDEAKHEAWRSAPDIEESKDNK